MARLVSVEHITGLPCIVCGQLCEPSLGSVHGETGWRLCPMCRTECNRLVLTGESQSLDSAVRHLKERQRKAFEYQEYLNSRVWQREGSGEPDDLQYSARMLHSEGNLAVFELVGDVREPLSWLQTRFKAGEHVECTRQGVGEYWWIVGRAKA